MEDVRLICFDLDDTLISRNSWQRLNLALGMTREEDKRLFDEYSVGDTTYAQWAEKVVEYYLRHEDATREGITRILYNYEYAPHAREVVSFLQDKGYEIGLISGSIDLLVSHIAHELGIKYAKAHNTAVFDENDRLVSIRSTESDAAAKPRYLAAFAEALNISLNQCACIGDGANDIGLFRATGKGVTFKGSPIEKDAWKVIETLKDLETVFA